MNLESPEVAVQKSQQETFDFLSNVENYRQLMPESMEKFEVITQDTFSFQLKGMPQIQLQIKEKKAPELIILGSTSPKFDFSLQIDIEAKDDNNSLAQLFFDGNFNAMMAMMVKSPLQKFITTLSENLSKH